MRLLNLGCGEVYHPDWVNLDLHPAGPGVLRHDLSRPLPFGDREFDAVYSSHTLEHLSSEAAHRLMSELVRVLRPGGHARVAVPDLEQIARLYLERLEGAERGEPGAEADYDWMVLELLDQLVREQPGGRMLGHLAGQPVPNADFVRRRIGHELDSILRPPPERSLLERLRGKTIAGLLDRAREAAGAIAARALGGPPLSSRLRLGRMASSGELHRWMYDRFSLRRLLERHGLNDVRRCDWRESRIPGFAGYGLEAVGGEPRKPDSLTMEATKP
ncbi:MAG: methyltransferase domain-containing protein [Myxococcales bacterium]|nr:methyltransferase domain-containing protein [Myxococcales bacterium]